MASWLSKYDWKRAIAAVSLRNQPQRAVELTRHPVTSLHAIVKSVFRFVKRRKCVRHKPRVVGRAASPKPFSDVRWNTRNSIAQLCTKLEVTRSRARSRKAVHFHPQFIGNLPHDQLFVVLRARAHICPPVARLVPAAARKTSSFFCTHRSFCKRAVGRL